MPISTATNTAGTPIHLVAYFGEGAMAITPDGKTVYVLSYEGTQHPGMVVPIRTATNTAGKPIKVTFPPYGFNGQIAIPPDGKTAYVTTEGNWIIPISTATNTAGPPIRFGSDCYTQRYVHAPYNIAITPDGKTAYVSCGKAVVPISTATNTLGRPIHIPLTYAQTIAITP
jgi:DNA-binding beta-propeller fold protein YncE